MSALLRFRAYSHEAQFICICGDGNNSFVARAPPNRVRSIEMDGNLLFSTIMALAPIPLFIIPYHYQFDRFICFAYSDCEARTHGEMGKLKSKIGRGIWRLRVPPILHALVIYANKSIGLFNVHHMLAAHEIYLRSFRAQNRFTGKLDLSETCGNKYAQCTHHLLGVLMDAMKASGQNEMENGIH